MPDGFVPPDLHPNEAEFTDEHLRFPVRRTTLVSWLVVAVCFLVATIVMVVAVPSIGAVFVLVAVLAVVVVWIVGRQLVEHAPALLVDHEGLHADGHVVRWEDFTGIELAPAIGVATTLTVGTSNGSGLHRPASLFRCRLSRVEQLVGLWAAEHRPAGTVSEDRRPGPGGDAHGLEDGSSAPTDADWQAAAASQAPDDEWLAFGERPDEDPFHR